MSGRLLIWDQIFSNGKSPKAGLQKMADKKIQVATITSTMSGTNAKEAEVVKQPCLGQ